MSVPKRILVVQTAFLGDIVLTTPLLRAMRRAYPEARITVVTTPLGAATLSGVPFVDQLIAYDKKGKDRGVAGVWRLARTLRSARVDLAIAAQRSARTGFLVRLTGAPRRIGFAGAAGSWAYTERVPWDSDRHAVHRYLQLAGSPADADARPELAVLPGARCAVDDLLAAEGIAPDRPIVAIAPGSVWGTKRWTEAGYAEVVVAAATMGLAPVLVGSPDEKGICDRVAALSAAHPPVLAGRTGIPELTALLARARAVVTNDSGPGHVASAVGTPVVALFGPTVPAFGYTPFGPENRIIEREGLDCRPCDRHGPQVCPLGHHRCMREIPAERVIEALRGIVGGRARSQT